MTLLTLPVHRYCLLLSQSLAMTLLLRTLQNLLLQSLNVYGITAFLRTLATFTLSLQHPKAPIKMLQDTLSNVSHSIAVCGLHWNPK